MYRKLYARKPGFDTAAPTQPTVFSRFANDTFEFGTGITSYSVACSFRTCVTLIILGNEPSPIFAPKILSALELLIGNGQET